MVFFVYHHFDKIDLPLYTISVRFGLTGNEEFTVR